MAVETEMIEASEESTMMAASIGLDMACMPDVLTRIDRLDRSVPEPVVGDLSGVFSIALNDYLLDAFIRLFHACEDERDAAFLGESIIDEIYYRLICYERGGELHYLLRQQGDFARISKTVAHIHENIDQPVSVQALADMVHMNRTTFYENFIQVMHLAPLQYAKFVKLFRTQSLIQQDMPASEAAYKVGCSSAASTNATSAIHSQQRWLPEEGTYAFRLVASTSSAIGADSIIRKCGCPTTGRTS